MKNQWSCRLLLGVAASFACTHSASADFVEDFTDPTVSDRYPDPTLDFAGGGTLTYDPADPGTVTLAPSRTPADGIGFVGISQTTDVGGYEEDVVITVNASETAGFFTTDPNTLRDILRFGADVSGVGRLGVELSRTSGGGVPGLNYRFDIGGVVVGAARIDGAGTNFTGQDVVFAFDDDSYSLTLGATSLVADTAHGLDFTAASTAGVGGYIEALRTFGGNPGIATFVVDSHSLVSVPEPGALSLIALGTLALANRRRRQAAAE